MIGIFDSGVGGLSALDEVRKIAPKADICFLADRNNAPYGTKTKEEVKKLAEANIEKLLSLGAEKILIACCTASTVYHELSDFHKSISVPIIEISAKRAFEISKTKRIGLYLCTTLK